MNVFNLEDYQFGDGEYESAFQKKASNEADLYSRAEKIAQELEVGGRLNGSGVESFYENLNHMKKRAHVEARKILGLSNSIGSISLCDAMKMVTGE